MRTAKKGDADRIAELYASTIGQVRNPYRYCMKFIKRKSCTALEIDGRIVGAYMIAITPHPNPYSMSRTEGKRYCWLEQIMVFPDSQGNGYGTMLINDFIRKHGNYEMRLVCEPKLVSWYRMFDFRVIRYITHNKKTQAIMVREQ